MKETLHLNMNLDNACFEGEDLAEGIAHSLRDLADRIEEQSRNYLAGNGNRMRISDINGNTIGFCHLDVESTPSSDKW